MTVELDPARSGRVSRHAPARAAGADARSDLGPLFRRFLTHSTPWVLGAWLAAAVAVRVALGRWGWADLVLAGTMLASQPFVEWVIHLGVLHFRPRRLGRWTVDLHLAREHRGHHLDPRDFRLIFIPVRSLVEVVVAATVGAWLIAPSAPRAATFVAVLAVQLSVYEWIHYLIHTTHRPRSRWFSSIARSHRLHHHRNERYWLGVTSNVGDRVLRTNPARGDVPLSATARNLPT